VSTIRTYDLHGALLAVQSPDATLVDLLAPRLRRFVAMPAAPAAITFHYAIGSAAEVDEPIPPTARPVYETTQGEVSFEDESDRLFMHYPGRVRSIANLATGVVHTVLAGRNPDDGWVASHPFFTLGLLEQLKRFGLYGLHAALLAHHGRAVIVAGTSGAGKSTVSLSLLRAGWAFGGDDICFTAPGLGGPRILAFPDELDVSDDTIAFFPELAPLRERPPRPDARKWPLLPEEVYPVDFVDACAPGILLFPRIAHTDRSRVEEMGAAEALMELVPNVLLTDVLRSQLHLDALGDLVRRSHCFRLHTGRDFDDLPRLLQSLVPAGAGAA
jgi:hypothetical protein